MQGPIDLSDTQIHGTLLNCLTFAAQGYEEIATKQYECSRDARERGELNMAGVHQRLAEQFDRQEKEAKELIELFSEANRVTLRPDDEDEA